MADKTQPSEIKLIDGTVLKAVPLKISLLRPFMTRFADLTKVAEDNDKSMDVLLDCVQIALKQYKPELADDREALEENIDLPTVYKLVDAASGVNLQGVDTNDILNTVGKK
ncbi:MAG: hypothetical protein EBV82_04930 [Chitinophagia bacterium]|jgi:hypothetical protein|nr:hypothetical protein [Chitinophagia bacterium]